MSMMSGKKCSPLNYVCTREKCDLLAQPTGMLRSRLKSATNLFRKDLYSHYGCVNAIEFSKDGDWLVSGGDDRRILLWNLEKAIHGQMTGHPKCMSGEHTSNIFCLGFDNSNHNMFSAGNDQQVIVHDMNTGSTVDVFMHEEAVYGLSVDPLNDSVFASACDDGRILVWDIREPPSTGPFCLASYASAFHAVVYNPTEPRLLATANSKEGVSLWDIRKPLSVLLRYHQDSRTPHQIGRSGAMSVRFNSMGNQILALRRRLPPVLYDITSYRPRCQFDHPGYYNSCTMKSCCFAGDEDEYVLSGSDDFNLYMWKIPDEANSRSADSASWVKEAHMVLKGHRSIVNQVRFNAKNFMMASSGVEKIIKLWSSFPMPGSSGGLVPDVPSKDDERKVYTHEEYINLVLHSGQVHPMMTHDYSHQSTQEDPRMMAFFDTLVQRETEGWTSDSSMSSTNTESWLFNVVERVSISEVDSSSSEDAEEEEEDDDDDDGDDDNNDNDRRSASRPPNSDPDDTGNKIPYLNCISQLIAQKRQQQQEQRDASRRFAPGRMALYDYTVIGGERSAVSLETSGGPSGGPSPSPSRSGVTFTSGGGTTSSGGLNDRRRMLQKRRMRILRDLPSEDEDDDDAVDDDDDDDQKKKKEETEDVARTRPVGTGALRSNGTSPQSLADRVVVPDAPGTTKEEETGGGGGQNEGRDLDAEEEGTRAKRPRLPVPENGRCRERGPESSQ